MYSNGKGKVLNYVMRMLWGFVRQHAASMFDSKWMDVRKIYLKIVNLVILEIRIKSYYTLESSHIRHWGRGVYDLSKQNLSMYMNKLSTN